MKMIRHRLLPPIAALLALVFATSLFARGQIWDFLGYTQIDRSRDHSQIQITRHDCLFRAVQVRVSGDTIFFDHLVFHFGDGSSQEFVVAGRIFPEGSNYIIELPGAHRILESVELWYYKEPWEHSARVSLYGVRCSDSPDAAATQNQ